MESIRLPKSLAPYLLATVALWSTASAFAQGGPAARADRPPQTTPTNSFYEPDNGLARRAPASTAATGEAVVSAADPLAAAAGLEILQMGGNAMDAALAMAITLTVVEPQSSGLGGGSFLIAHNAKTGRTHSIDGRETAPASAKADRFLQPDGRVIPFMQAVPGGYSVGVPGALALIHKAHQASGQLPWAALFGPAIRHAREGFPVSARLNLFSNTRKEMLRADKNAARIFLSPEGEAWPVGHILRQEELAQTLETLAKEGPDAFYKGPIGQQISQSVANAFANPTALTASDLANYHAKDRSPLCASYRAYDVCSMGPPSSGGIAVVQILKLLERFDLKSLGADNVLAQHLFAESQRLAYADREAYGADSDFVTVPLKGLLDPTYLANRSQLIQLHTAMPAASAVAGKPKGVGKPNPHGLSDIPATTHIVSADQAGNVVSLTATIEGPFGSGLVAAGLVLNNELTDFNLDPRLKDGSLHPNAVSPGKRPRSSMAPTLLFKDGQPVAAFGAAGGATIIAQVAKAIIHHVDFGYSIEEALGAPQILANHRGLTLEAGTDLTRMMAALKALGHQNIRSGTMPLKGNALARVTSHSPQGQKLQWRAAADPRSEGQAMSLNPTGPTPATQQMPAAPLTAKEPQ